MRMVIDKICKMTVNSVKSKSESFFSISRGVLELWRKNLIRRIRPPPPALIGLNEVSVYIWELTRGISSLKELAGVGKGFLNDFD